MIKSRNPKLAYEKGYRVINGEVHGTSGKILSAKNVNTSGYRRFSFRGDRRVHLKCMIHQLVAYQKFGDKIFLPEIETRHMDGNLLNNYHDNIEIGTKSDNEMDKLVSVRLRSSLLAASKVRKFTNDEVNEIRAMYNEIKSYKKVMAKFGISSKGTLHHILNHEYKTFVGVSLMVKASACEVGDVSSTLIPQPNYRGIA